MEKPHFDGSAASSIVDSPAGNKISFAALQQRMQNLRDASRS